MCIWVLYKAYQFGNMLEVGSNEASILKLVKGGMETHTPFQEPQLESNALDHSTTLTIGWVGHATISILST